MSNYYLNAVTLGEDPNIALNAEVEQERKVAVFDLLEENSFKPIFSGSKETEGPFALDLSIHDGRLVFDIKDEANDNQTQVILSLSPFRQVIKDYFQICEAYFDAVKNLPPAQIEAIDMGRRGIHNEGARLLEERLEGKIELDNSTARRLFTLISVLHFKG